MSLTSDQMELRPQLTCPEIACTIHGIATLMQSLLTSTCSAPQIHPGGNGKIMHPKALPIVQLFANPTVPFFLAPLRGRSF
ncbi:MAG: hypothetical protein VXZ09_16620, partial [Pseudomonadota bacterium]|nr:hypothetical protein [Pseudomonadota bacterium]